MYELSIACHYSRSPPLYSMVNAIYILGRVICAILGLTDKEQHEVMAGVARLAPSVAAVSAIQTISSSLYLDSISSLFS